MFFVLVSSSASWWSLAQYSGHHELIVIIQRCERRNRAEPQNGSSTVASLPRSQNEGYSEQLFDIINRAELRRSAFLGCPVKISGVGLRFGDQATPTLGGGTNRPRG
jgi:hypothetical protein